MAWFNEGDATTVVESCDGKSAMRERGCFSISSEGGREAAQPYRVLIPFYFARDYSH